MTIFYLKSIHVALAVIWVSGLLALLLCRSTLNNGDILLRWNACITIPAMAATLASGLWLTVLGKWLSSGQFWLMAKLILAAVLIATHGYQSGWLLRAAGQGSAAKKFSFANGSLWVAAISLIIFLVETKPF